jgi:hypothetical protein
LKETDHLGDLGLDGRMILKYILKEEGVSIYNRFIWLRKGTKALVKTVMNLEIRVQ